MVMTTMTYYCAFIICLYVIHLVCVELQNITSQQEFIVEQQNTTDTC